MSLHETAQEWEALGAKDPYWAILTWKGKTGSWEVNDFFHKGELNVQRQFDNMRRFGIDCGRGKALDFGCGVGRLTQALAKRFKTAVGVDIAPSMIAKAKEYDRQRNKRHNCLFLLNKQDNLRVFSDNTFDFIYTDIVLQHMEPRYSLRYIAEFGRILKNGGVCVFQIPGRRVSRLKQAFIDYAPRSLIVAIRRFRNPYGNIIESYPVPRKQVEKQCAKNGLRVVGVLRDNASGPAFISYRYFCRKE